MVVIEKSNGSLQVCIETKDLNKAIKRKHYPMKSLDEVFTKLEGEAYFSVLDAGQAYYQLPVSSQSQELLRFNSSFGHYCFQRMAFVIKFAPEMWQRIMSQIFENLFGLEVIMDDILGMYHQEHNERLHSA